MLVNEQLGYISYLLCDELFLQVVCPEEVSACVLMKMKHAAEDRLGCQVDSAVVTVPGTSRLLFWFARAG